jgi:LytR cell envelope-related transcriptional attenuator
LDAPLSPQELVRPWRTATLVASLVAAVELVLLLIAGAVLVAGPLTHVLRRHATTAAAAAPAAKVKKTPPPAHVQRRHVPPPKPHLARGQTGVLVLNGNGENGAAATEAGKLRALGYPVTATANAHRQDYATSVVLYRPGYQAEGTRLAHDLGIAVVGPLDGLPASRLGGGKLAVIVGA